MLRFYLSSPRLFGTLCAATLSLHAFQARADQAPCKPPAGLAARVQARPESASYGAIGNYFGEHRQYTCAVEAFREALALDPHSSRLLYLEALNLDLAGQPAEAAEALNRAITLAPRSSPNHLLLGTIQAELKNPTEAKLEWQKALELDASSVAALDLLSRAEIAEGNLQRAIVLLRSAPALVAKSEDLTVDLAIAYGKAGLLDQAADLLSHALQANPASQRLNGVYVTALVQQTLFIQAETVARAFASQHPHNPEAQRVYLETLILNNDNKDASQLATRLLATSPHDPEILFLNGVLERNRSELPAARKHLEEAEGLNPTRPAIHAQLGFVLAALHDDAGASTQFKQALELGDQDPPTRFALATALRNLGQTAQSQEQLKLYQQQLQAKAAAKLASGKAAQAAEAMKAHHPEQAIPLYREALEATPNDADLMYELSVALDRTGNIAEEQTTLEGAVQLDPGLAAAQNQLGYLASQRGNPAEAEKRFRLAVQASPAYVDAWISLAATLGMEHKLPEAFDAVATALKIDPKNSGALSLRDALNAARATP